MGEGPLQGFLRPVLFSFFFLSGVCAQSISTNTRLPALQWIRLDKLTSGPAPPALKDASIGYDEITRQLLVFGGESSSGYSQATTYLLNLDTLAWKSPSPPSGFDASPPARSSAISGGDFAANSRHGHIVIGGKGADGNALTDVWEFNYLYDYWTQVSVDAPTGPKGGRFGGVGGIDTRLDPVNSALTSKFYLAGGSDGSKLYPTSDLWRLDISGVLSPNVPGGVTGTWHHTPTKDGLPSIIGQGGAVLSENTSEETSRVVAFGGCNSTNTSGDSCAKGDSFVLYTPASSSIAPAACAAPRLGAAVAANMNSFDSSFQSQAFVLLGTFNSSLWDDGKGLEGGEVDIIDVKQGGWTRVIPAKDPQNGVPQPRQGAAVVAVSSAIVGGSRSSSSDILVFGGKDRSNNYLSDIWILRAYNGIITASSQQWSGYGNGNLQSGPNASGTGVTLQYQTSCASAIHAESSSSTHTSASTTGHSVSSTPTASPSPTTTPTSAAPPLSSPYDTNILHKVLLPVSFVLCTFSILLFRTLSSNTATEHIASTRLFYILICITYGLAVAGLALSFTSIHRSTTLATRSSHSRPHLKTAHSDVGLALTVAFLLLAPVLWLRSSRRYPIKNPATTRVLGEASATGIEKPDDYFAQHGDVPATSTPQRAHSTTNGIQGAPPTIESIPNVERLSTDTEHSTHANSSGVRSFEVTNRPTHARHSTANSLTAFAEFAGFTRQQQQLSSHDMQPRSLSEVSWLERRRSLIAVDELDYALTQMRKTPGLATPATMPVGSQVHIVSHKEPSIHLFAAEKPSVVDVILHLLLHILVLATAAFTLHALWTRSGSRAAFGIFLAWILVFYILFFILTWFKRSQRSILAVFFNHIRPRPLQPEPGIPEAGPSSPKTTEELRLPPGGNSSPYLHQPPHRLALGPHEDDLTSTSQAGPRSHDGYYGDDEDDEDEDARQQRIEAELNRRQVAIVTVPRQRLFIANAS